MYGTKYVEFGSKWMQHGRPRVSIIKLALVIRNIVNYPLMIYKLTTLPTIISHNSSHRTNRVSSVQLGASASDMNSPTATSVWQGCKYQQGVPRVGWSPCDKRGNGAAGRVSAKVVVSEPSGGLTLKNEVCTRSARDNGSPSVKHQHRDCLSTTNIRTRIVYSKVERRHIEWCCIHDVFVHRHSCRGWLCSRQIINIKVVDDKSVAFWIRN